MKWTLDHSQLPSYLRVIVEGKANSEEARALLDDLISSERWHPGMSVLIDTSGIPPTGSNRNVIIQDLVRYFIERKQDIGKSCIATVRPRSDAYNYIRQFEYGIRLRGSEAVVRNFMSESHAADWLKNHAGMCGVEKETTA